MDFLKKTFSSLDYFAVVKDIFIDVIVICVYDTTNLSNANERSLIEKNILQNRLINFRDGFGFASWAQWKKLSFRFVVLKVFYFNTKEVDLTSLSLGFTTINLNY